MIKLLGVINHAGLPIKIKSFVEIQSEELVASLVEATKALSGVLGRGSVRKIDFGEDKLLVTESDKKYTIIALVDVAEEYVEAFLRFLADDIDRSDVPKSPDIVDSTLVESISRILDRYIKENIEISMLDLMEQVWDPMSELISSYEGGVEYLEKARKDIKGSIRRHNKMWKDFLRKTKPKCEMAVRYMLEGMFSHACRCCIDSKDPLMRGLSVKAGLLAHSVIGVPAPPLEILEEVADSLPDDDPFLMLVKMSARYITRGLSVSDYFEAYKKAMNSFDFGEDQRSLINAIVLWAGYLQFFPDFARRLMGYFEGKSRLIHDLIEQYLVEAEIFEKIYTVTKYSEVSELVLLWRSRIDDILREMDNILRFGGIKRVLGVYSKPEIRQKLLVYASMVRIYLDVLSLLLDSPLLGPNERKKTLEEIISISSRYSRYIIKYGLYCFISDILGILQNYAIALSELFFFTHMDERSRIMDEMREALRIIYDITCREYPKIGSYYISYVITAACFLGLPLAIQNIVLPEEIQTIYSIVQLVDPRITETLPYQQAANLENLTSILAALVLRIGGESTEILERCIDILVEIYKWFIFQGQISRSSTMLISYVVSKLIDNLDEEKVRYLADFLEMLTRITVPDWEKNDYDLALIAEAGIIDVFISAWRKLGEERYLLLAEKIFSIAKDAWKKYGFTKKARELHNKYAGKIRHMVS